MFDVLIMLPNLIFDSLRFHFSPVVVVFVDGAPTGKSPQCGPSTDDSI